MGTFLLSGNNDELFMKDFKFISNVPNAVRPHIRESIAAWIERADCPVIGVTTPFGEVDFCRRPWPPHPGVITTVGSERNSDEELLLKWAAQLCSDTREE